MSETKIPTGLPPPYHLSQLNQAEKNLKTQKLKFFTNINNIKNFLKSLKLELPEKTSPEYNNTLIKKYNEIIDLLHNKIIEANDEEDEGAEEEITFGHKLPLLTNKGGKKRRRRKTKRKRKKSKRKSRKKRKTRRRKK